MVDEVSQARDHLRHARQDRMQRAADFWQRTLNEGRVARQAERQQMQAETPVQRQRGPYRKQQTP